MANRRKGQNLMPMSLNRRGFLKKTMQLGIGYSLPYLGNTTFSSKLSKEKFTNSELFPTLKKGDNELFVDNVMIAHLIGIQRKVHAASKLDQPVLTAEMSWEQGDIHDGQPDKRIYIYGTVLRDPKTGTFKMWYNRYRNNYYAVSEDGVNWERPNLGQLGENNMIDLFDFHSPSIIRDDFESNLEQRYKAMGSIREFSKREINQLKEKFGTLKWYERSSAYAAAYSADGIKWNYYTENPMLLSSDTITLSQDPETGEYLAFHKLGRDPRTKPIDRQVYLSISNDIQIWSEPELVMITDDLDHQQARLLEGGTHSEFYNMSAYPYGNQWLGFVTHFRRTGQPEVKKGPMQSMADGPIDVQLVHSRDGRNWERCSDRSPVIPLGPHSYDTGSILGLCNSPVIVGDEMWMYYTAMTTTHGGALPEKQMSIARASWRLDGMSSLQAGATEGVVETQTFISEENNLSMNADISKGRLRVEVLDVNRDVIRGYEKENCVISNRDAIELPIQWSDSQKLPSGIPIRLRFYLKQGDLFSYTIE